MFFETGFRALDNDFISIMRLFAYSVTSMGFYCRLSYILNSTQCQDISILFMPHSLMPFYCMHPVPSHKINFIINSNTIYE